MANIRPTFVPWLFDDREAFEKTVNDSRYKYNMPFNSFMNLYRSYRNGQSSANLGNVNFFASSASTQQKKVTPTVVTSVPEQSQILSQAEIDALIAQATAA